MIIDHIDNVELRDEDAEQYFNEFHTLKYLWTGLSFLNYQVQKMETEVNNRLDENYQVFMLGNHPQLKGIPQDFIACAFHWYSVTACNYVKLVGWIINGGATVEAHKYLQDILPEVYLWRNKVGAHFAQTAPREEDTPADLAKSVMFPIAFEDDAFYSNSLVLGLKSGDQGSSSRQDMKWSLTHTHKQLVARYWPNGSTDV